MRSERGPGRGPDAEKPLLHRTVRVPGHVSSISPVVDGLMDAVKDSPCVAGREFAIETALREALANAVLHGCRNDAAQVVECALSCSGSGGIHIVVRDPGRGFDPASVPDPLAEENLCSTHGRGVFLITGLMDRVWFEHGGAEIHMVLEPAQPLPAAGAWPVPPLPFEQKERSGPGRRA